MPKVKEGYKRYNIVLNDKESKMLEKILKDNDIGFTEFIRISMYSFEKTVITFDKKK